MLRNIELAERAWMNAMNTSDVNEERKELQFCIRQLKDAIKDCEEMLEVVKVVMGDE